MGIFDKLKETISVATGKAPPDLSQLSPEQRARYDATMANVEQTVAQAEANHEVIEAAAAERRVFHGAPAAFLAGGEWRAPSPVELEKIRVEHGTKAMIAASQPPGGTLGQVRRAVGDTLGRRTGPPEIEDPQKRLVVAAAERVARDAARAPYLATNPLELTFSRIATHGDSQIEELQRFLAQTGLASRPDLVWGVSRVPDRIDPMLTRSSERSRVVEWDVVHVPRELPATDAPPHAAFFSSRQQWVARRIGEPGVLDEDLGRAYASNAGFEVEDCIGIARFPHLRGDAGDEGSFIETWVEGVYVLHQAGSGRPGSDERMSAAAPISLDLAQLPPARTEVLDWEAIASIVHPQPQLPPRVPNPVPQLPSTPQELLRAYLEVVGVRPADCWSAQVTVDTNEDLTGRSGMVSHNTGPKLACADGTSRPRLHGAQQVVVVYRDRPEYVTGRGRWQAYQQVVLEARLDGRSEQRRVLTSDRDPAFLRAIAIPTRAVDWLDRVGVTQPPPYYRYCSPAVG